jgi:hypothetical protein
LEGYLFKPLEAIVQSQDQEAALERDFTKVYFAATAGLVLHSAVGPISLSVNYYDDNENPLGSALACRVSALQQNFNGVRPMEVLKEVIYSWRLFSMCLM